MQEKDVLRLVFIALLLAPAASAHSVAPVVTKDALGTTIVAHLESAPFPDGKAKYTDDTVVIFVPRHYAPRERVDIVTFHHGHYSTALASLEALRVREQLVISRKEAVLVAPQGPVYAKDSSSGKLERPGAFARLLGDVVGVLVAERLAPAGATVGTVVVVAHSGGFEAGADAARLGGAPVGQVIVLDGLYGRFDQFAEWIAGDPKRRFASLVTEGGRPDERTMYLKGALRRRGVTRWLDERVEGRSSRRDLMRSRVLLLTVRMGHVESAYAHLALRDLLMVGPLRHSGKHEWYAHSRKHPRVLERYQPPS